jgi:aryl-alcohol dehydrogenase-like predicted oxidoreductase
MPADRLRGAATASGTRRGAEVFEAGARTLGRTGLTVSPVGFGGYRVRDDSPVHRRALADALRSGINLVDTSTNYGDGRSERLVGLVLANLVQQGELRREEVTVVTKVGYLQGSNLARARARAPGYPEIVEVDDDLAHCIHPEFLRDQIGESLERLGIEHIDVLLLHNPEYFLAHAAPGRDRAELRAAYDARLRAAFEALEAEVRGGRIGAYGVSSNGFVVPSSDPSFTSVDDVLRLAHEVGGDAHRLAVVQMPMNLLELGAATERHPTRAGERTPLEIAAAADLGVLANRPLNAFAPIGGRTRLVRLADAAGSDAPPDDAGARLAVVRKLEAQWADDLGGRLRTAEGEDASDLFRFGQELTRRLGELGSLEEWQRLRHQVIAPHLGRTSAELLAALQSPEREQFASWWEQYGTALHAAFTAIEQRLGAERRRLSADLAGRLDPLLPAPWRELPLSRKAVLALLGAPIGAVLVGMRQPRYVFDMLALREHPVRLLSASAGAADLSAIAAALAGL